MPLSVLLLRGNNPAETEPRPLSPVVEQKSQLLPAAPLSDTSLPSWGWAQVSARGVSSLDSDAWSQAQLSALSPQLSLALSGPFRAD